jgi:hypothetical protein
MKEEVKDEVKGKEENDKKETTHFVLDGRRSVIWIRDAV